MFKAILFDMDGVIVDTEPLHHKAYYLMFRDINIKVSDALYASFTGQSTMEISKQLISHFNLPLGPHTLTELKRKHFKKLFKGDSSLQLLDGVLNLIKDYHSHGLTLVLASSASMKNINRIFKRFDLDQYFSAKISGADLKASKPHPEIFTKAAELSGKLPKECLVIEDSTNGIKAARAAGIYCVGYNSLNSKDQDYTEADMTISCFKEIAYDKLQKMQHKSLV